MYHIPTISNIVNTFDSLEKAYQFSTISSSTEEAVSLYSANFWRRMATLENLVKAIEMQWWTAVKIIIKLLDYHKIEPRLPAIASLNVNQTLFVNKLNLNEIREILFSFPTIELATLLIKTRPDFFDSINGELLHKLYLRYKQHGCFLDLMPLTDRQLFILHTTDMWFIEKHIDKISEYSIYRLATKGFVTSRPAKATLEEAIDADAKVILQTGNRFPRKLCIKYTGEKCQTQLPYFKDYANVDTKKILKKLGYSANLVQ